MTDTAVMCAAVYRDADVALADLGAFEDLFRREGGGIYDAAVIDNLQGVPRIVKRAEHPTVDAIPELLDGESLREHPLREAAAQLRPDESAFVLLGPSTLEKAFDRSAKHATLTAKRPLDAQTDQVVFG